MLSSVERYRDYIRREPSEKKKVADPVSLAKAALKLAEQYDTPPEPTTFAVWYAFASGKQERLCQKIRELIEANGSISPYDLEQLQHLFLSETEEQRRQQEAAGYRLDREIHKTSALMRNYIATNSHLDSTIQSSANVMTATTKPELLQSAVESILLANGKMRAESAKLNHSLEQIRIEVRKHAAELQRARQKEFRDSLTLVANRDYFDRALPGFITEAFATGHTLSVVIADLDYLGVINETYGHTVGNDVLKYFAALLQKSVRARDVVARHGGDEFAVLLPAIGVQSARAFIQGIKAELDRANLVISRDKNPIGRVSASYGIAQLRHGENGADLVKRVEEQLREAKNTGKNRIACDKP
jgi:diguanylate cyclase